MPDDLINIGCAFDWITPTFAFLRDFAAGPVAHFGISAYSGYDRGDIRRLLQAHGVQVWGLIYNFEGDMLMFTVPNTHARWAYYILRQQGIPILYVPKEATGKETAGLSPATIPDEPASFMDHFFNF